MKSRSVVGVPALIAAVALAFGIPVGALPSSQFPQYTLTEGKLDADGLPISGAKLCVPGRQENCYQMPSETYSNSDLKYEFGLGPHAERLLLPNGGSWVFFSAMFSGGGSGTLTRFAVLRYGSDAKMENLLPWVGATNVSEWAMWTVKDASAYPVLVHADFVWGDGESHFDFHFYKVEAWRFDAGADRYEKAFEYKTSRKYGGGDASPIRILGPERAEIIRHLKAK